MILCSFGKKTAKREAIKFSNEGQKQNKNFEEIEKLHAFDKDCMSDVENSVHLETIIDVGTSIND